MQLYTNAPLRRRARAAFLIAILPVIASGTADAALYAWNGSASGNWSDRLNWKGGAIPASSPQSVLEFWPTGTAPIVANNDLPGTFTLWNIDGRAPTTLNGNPLRFVVNPNQTTFPFAWIGNNTDTSRFTINNDIIVDATELHVIAKREPGALVFNGAFTGAGKLLSRGGDTVLNGASPDFTGTFEVSAGTLTLGPNARVGAAARVLASPPFGEGRLVLSSPANVARDGQVEVALGALVQPKVLETPILRRISPDASGVLAVAQDTLIADAYDLTANPKLNIGGYHTGTRGIVTLTGSITPARDTYRFGGSNRGHYLHEFQNTLEVASLLTDAHDGTPRTVNISANGTSYGEKVRLSNPSNSYSGGTVVEKRHATEPAYLTIDRPIAPGQTPFGTGPVTVHGALLFAGEGTAGSVPNEIRLRPGSNLLLDNVTLTNASPDIYAANPRDRWPDARPLQLDGTVLRLRTAGSTAFTEKVGALSYTGGSQVEFNTQHAAETSTLQADSLTRRGRGTLVLSRTDRSYNYAGLLKPGDASALIDARTGMLHASVVEDNTVASDYVFARFLRPDEQGVLKPIAYVTTYNPATDAEIVFRGSHVLTSDEAAHAVSLDTMTIGAGKMLTLRGGGIIIQRLLTSTNTISGGAIAFADAGAPVEGLIYSSFNASTRITTSVTAADGLTFFGDGSITLAAPNSFTGPLTVNGGSSVTLEHPDALPTGTAVHVDAESGLNLRTSITVPALSGYGVVGTPSNFNATLTVDAADDVEFAGELIDRPTRGSVLSLVKTGPGSLTLTGRNTRKFPESVTNEPFASGGYSGLTTVRQGTLNLKESFLRYGSYATESGAHIHFFTDHAIGRLGGNGNATVERAAVVTADQVTQHALRLERDAKLNLRPSNGTSTARNEVSQLDIAPGATLDLADNDLFVHSAPASLDQVVRAVSAHVRAARNASAGRWTGPGLTGSVAASDPLTTLAVGLLGDDVLVKYTYNGDANLDGRINADDYFRIDQGFLAQPSDPLFSQGDFNYDGRVNADDYFLIDQAFLGQGTPLTGSGDSSPQFATAVPEPAAALTLAILTLASLPNRRRRAQPEP